MDAFKHGAAESAGPMSFHHLQAKVRAFHKRFGVPAPDSPILFVYDGRSTLRRNWILDELDEMRDAINARDLAELADSYIDILYFCLGGLVEMGIEGGPLFAEVHRKNMAKIKLPGVEKIAKPAGWKPPRIAELIEKQRRK